MIDTKGCGFQCVKKITGLASKALLENCKILGIKDEFLNDDQILKILNLLDFKRKIQLRNKRIVPGPHKYILCVPSLNIQGGLHYIVAWYSGHRKMHVWDSANGLKYVSTNKSNLKPGEIRLQSWAYSIKVQNKSYGLFSEKA